MRIRLLAATLALLLTARAGVASATGVGRPTATQAEAAPTLAASLSSATATPSIISLPAKLQLIEFFAGT